MAIEAEALRDAPEVQKFDVTGDDGCVIHFAGSACFCFEAEVTAYQEWATSEIEHARADNEALRAELAQVSSILSDPVAVHINLLRGKIAKPSVEQILHLYPDLIHRSALAEDTARAAEGIQARPLEEWHEDMGDVLWWSFPIREAPYVGSPLDEGRSCQIKLRLIGEEHTHHVSIGGWPGYHTHWTPLPAPPALPLDKEAADANR